MITNYVSSECDRYKRERLNNVILSLNCFISCSSNDKTVQEYGTISYTGPITVGQTIQGSKIPRRANTPVVYDNTFLGVIDNNGNLVIKNTCASTSSWTVENKYTNITYTLYNDESLGNRYCCDLVSCVSNTECSTSDGYTIETTTTTFCYCITESTQFSRPYMVYNKEWYEDTYLMKETGRFCMTNGSLYAYVECCNDYEGCTYNWCWEGLSCFCDGHTCFTNMPPNGLSAVENTHHDPLDSCIYREDSEVECNFSLLMNAIQCCTIITTLCKKPISCISLDMRYV